MLYQLCNQFGFTVDEICYGWSDKENTKKYGYTHLISEGKYQVDDRLRTILQKLDMSLYAQVDEKIKVLKRKEEIEGVE